MIQVVINKTDLEMLRHIIYPNLRKNQRATTGEGIGRMQAIAIFA